MKKPNFSRIYNLLLKAHSTIPKLLCSSRALPLMQVSMEITHRCNLHCAMCFQAKRADAAGELTTQDIKRVIDGLPAWTIVTFTGGEPFMRKDFRELLLYSLKKRRCNMLTNAEFITDADIGSFVENNLTLIGISIDGIGETHDLVRDKNGLFAKAVSVIRKLSEKKNEKGTIFPLIDVKTVILKENMGELSRIYMLADELGADFFSLSLPKLSDRQFNEPYYHDIEKDIFTHVPQASEPLDETDMETLRRQLELVKGYRRKPTVRFYPYNMLGRAAVEKYYGGSLNPSDFAPCAVPWSLVCISPYGDVFPCLSYSVGNVRQSTLKEIWNGERFRSFRSRMSGKTLDQCCLGCCYSIYRNAVGAYNY